MGASSFSLERLQQNLAILSACAPEVVCWLEAEADFADAAHAPLPPPEQCARALAGHLPKAGGVTVVVGGGCLREVCRLLSRTPPGHQIFVLEPRAQKLCQGLGLHDLASHLAEGDLVLLAPSEMALEEALHRHPQLALAQELEVIDLRPLEDGAAAEAARARLYRLLGQALMVRDLALNWEGPSGANLIRNIGHVAFMGLAPGLLGSLKDRPAILAEAGPSLGPSLRLISGNLAGAMLFCSDQALPQVLNAGILPTGVVTTNRAVGQLFAFSHPWLAQVPLLAEEVAHAPTLMSHPGPRFLCLGPRLRVAGSLGGLAPAFTPQHHSLGRLAEVAIAVGGRPLILLGADLLNTKGDLSLPSMDGRGVPTSLEQAAAAASLGRVLGDRGQLALNTSLGGLGLPGTRAQELEPLIPQLGGPGQPLRIPALDKEAWLEPLDMELVAQGLEDMAGLATRLWQNAAAPTEDFPCLTPERSRTWLSSADRLFLALAEQAAAEPLLSSFMDGCLVRAFRRRHRLLCQGGDKGVKVQDACRELNRCLQDLESRGSELAVGLSQSAQEFSALAKALRRGDQAALSAFARECGHSNPA